MCHKIRTVCFVILGLLTMPFNGVAGEQSFHDFTVTSIDYTDMPLEDYKGKVVLLVNTASKCGYTPQYEGLQALHDTYQDRGFLVLGVPANDFWSQEPGTEDEIKQFCEVNFNIQFPMTKKMIVNGKEGTAPVYEFLAAELGDKSRPKWNFHKYLIDQNGKPVGYFKSRVKPNSTKILTAIDELLAGP